MLVSADRFYMLYAQNMTFSEAVFEQWTRSLADAVDVMLEEHLE